ncbi:uncharacterized protein LOC143281689 [Babylonia areolata]|uniref:uncharacterized protein LOC143281689 n=1 Tax=Babylonia areolata TaxID=304850 RepID=UPI003FD43FD2
MAIWSLIKASHNINRLNISHNCFNGKDYIWLARTLQLKSRLYALDISDNEFGFFGVSEFVEALEENDILEELIMDWNPLMCRGSAAVLNSVAKNMNLKQLGLAHTGVGSITVPAVEHLLMKNDFLQSLDLRRNHLTLDSQRAIHLAMEVSKTNMTVQL